MSLCEEEAYVELCRMEEPPALEEMRAAVEYGGMNGSRRRFPHFNKAGKKDIVSTYRKGRYFLLCSSSTTWKNIRRESVEKMLQKTLSGDCSKTRSCLSTGRAGSVKKCRGSYKTIEKTNRSGVY